MNDPTPVLERIQRWGSAPERRDVVTTTTRRGACVLAFVLLFLIPGVGSIPNSGTGAQGLGLRVASKPAKAETLTEVGNKAGGLLLTSARHKTH